MSIQKQFVVRYRVDGHVRFQVPPSLCTPAVADIVTEEINRISGVYRVNFYCGQRKLSIRYQHHICDFVALAKQLFDILERLEKQGCFEQKAAVFDKPTIKGKLKSLKVSRWFSEKYVAGKETLQAAKVITRMGLKKPKGLIRDPEKAIIDFLNDVLVLYLIKIHWTRITQEWIPRPFTYRYEWTAVFYLFYLLIRSRRPKK